MTARVALLLCVLVLVAGCGRKGPLYLPESSQDGAADTTETTD